jgi:hypothetical protein
VEIVRSFVLASHGFYILFIIALEVRKIMSSDLELPEELVDRPLALVGLTGLNVETNQTHLLIWNSFTSSNRSERPPLHFVLFGVNHAFPLAKPDVIYLLG